MIRKTVFFAIIATVPFTSAFALGKKIHRDNRPDAAALVLRAFRANCQETGAWSEGAAAQTDSIWNVIQGLKDNDACKPFLAKIERIQSLDAALQQNLSSSPYNAYKTFDNQLNELTIALQAATDPNLIGAINGQIAYIEQQRAQAKAAFYSASSDHNLNQAANMASLMNSLVLPVNASPTIADCLSQSPAAGVQLAGNLLAYGGSFISPALGAATSVVAQLFNAGIELLREDPSRRAEQAIQYDQMPQALRCGLESMSEFYCKAEDAISLLDLSAENVESSGVSTRLYRGIELENRSMPVLAHWLSQVLGGVDPQDSYAAAKKNAAQEQIDMIKLKDNAVLGAIHSALDAYTSSTGDSAKDGPIYNMISTVVNLLVPSQFSGFPSGNGGSTSPFVLFEGDQAKWACYLVLGYSSARVCPAEDVGPGGFDPSKALLNYIRKLLPNDAAVQTYTKIALQNWKGIVFEVKRPMDVQYQRVVQSNAGAIIADASQRGKLGVNSPSAIDVLNQLSEFFTDMLNYPSTASNPNLALELKNKINQVTLAKTDILDPAVCKDLEGDSDCPHHRLKKISDLFLLQNGTQVFGSAVSDLVQTDLGQRFANHEFPQNREDILKVLGADIGFSLNSVLSTTSLDSSGDHTGVSEDLASSQKTTKDNLRVFRNFFVGNFGESVKRLAREASGEELEGPHRPNGQLLGALCTQWLVTGAIATSPSDTFENWPDADTATICRAATIYSANRRSGGHYPVGIAVGELEKKIAMLPFGKRSCEFHKYRREEFLRTLPRFHY